MSKTVWCSCNFPSALVGMRCGVCGGVGLLSAPPFKATHVICSRCGILTPVGEPCRCASNLPEIPRFVRRKPDVPGPPEMECSVCGKPPGRPTQHAPSENFCRCGAEHDVPPGTPPEIPEGPEPLEQHQILAGWVRDLKDALRLMESGEARAIVDRVACQIKLGQIFGPPDDEVAKAEPESSVSLDSLDSDRNPYAHLATDWLVEKVREIAQAADLSPRSVNVIRAVADRLEAMYLDDTPAEPRVLGGEPPTPALQMLPPMPCANCRRAPSEHPVRIERDGSTILCDYPATRCGICESNAHPTEDHHWDPPRVAAEPSGGDGPSELDGLRRDIAKIGAGGDGPVKPFNVGAWSSDEARSEAFRGDGPALGVSRELRAELDELFPRHSPAVLDEIRAEALARCGVCSRCKRPIDGFALPDGGMTSGYYVAAGWPAFANPGEVYICDDCMWRDPRYVAVYGTQLPRSPRLYPPDGPRGIGPGGDGEAPPPLTVDDVDALISLVKERAGVCDVNADTCASFSRQCAPARIEQYEADARREHEEAALWRKLANALPALSSSQGELARLTEVLARVDAHGVRIRGELTESQAEAAQLTADLATQRNLANAYTAILAACGQPDAKWESAADVVAIVREAIDRARSSVSSKPLAPEKL